MFLNGGITPWFQSLGSSTVQGIETTIKFDLEYRTLFTRSSILLRPVPPFLVPSFCVSGHVVRAIFFTSRIRHRNALTEKAWEDAV